LPEAVAEKPGQKLLRERLEDLAPERMPGVLARGQRNEERRIQGDVVEWL
jgi:hypothetical protein